MKNINNPKGKIYLWKYPSKQNHFPGWSLTADKDGCLFLSEICSEFTKSKNQSSVTLKLNPPTLAITNIPLKGVRSVNAVELILSYKHSFNWDLTEKNKTVTLMFGVKSIDKIFSALADISRGEGGYSIGDGEENTLIWVWRLK